MFNKSFTLKKKLNCVLETIANFKDIRHLTIIP